MPVNESDAYSALPGTASDAVVDILATGRGEIGMVCPIRCRACTRVEGCT